MNSARVHSEIKADSEELRINELITQVIEIITQRLGKNMPFELYLYGSRAKNEAAKGADIDLAISCPQLNENGFRKIKREIENIRTLYSVDLIHLDKIDSDFREIILADAKKLHG